MSLMMPCNKIIKMGALIAAIQLASCHSSDLGSKSPDKVSIDMSLSEWNAGAGKVIEQKCANCHTSNRSPFVPANTPHELDGIGSQAFFQDPSNSGLVKSMLRRVESTDSRRQMPPRFATPLYDDEKSVLIAFLKASIPQGSSDTPSPNPPSVHPTFSDVAEIVSKNCGGCHNGRRAFSLRSREDFVAAHPGPLNEVEAGNMPPSNPAFKDSPDGLLLIQWLQGPQTH